MTKEFNLSEERIQLKDWIVSYRLNGNTLREVMDKIKEQDKEFIKKLNEGKRELKERNQRQRQWIPQWKLLSKQELLNKLIETLDSFDKDIDELIKIKKLAGDLI